MKKRFFLSFVVVLMSFIVFTQSLYAESRVAISVKIENIADSEVTWLAPAVAEKIESNLSKYTDFTFINTANRNDIINIQRQSEDSVFDEEDAIEIGKFKNADYQLFTTIRKVGEEYTVSVRLTDITTTDNKVPAIISKPRSAVQNLYSSTGSAIDEITIEFCKALGNPLSEKEINFLMKGELGLQIEEKQAVYDADVKLYNNRIKELNREISSVSSSTDLEAVSKQEKLKAEKVLAEEKLKLAQENKRRVEEEIKQRKADELKDSERTAEQKERLNSMSEELNKKVQSVRNAKFENKSLIGQIQVIELKKKAAVDIHKTIMAERKSIYETTFKNIIEKKKQIEERPYRSAELQSDGTPAEKAIAQRQRIYENTKNKLLATGQNDIDMITGKLGTQKKILLEEINSDYTKLDLRKISTLGNELVVTYGAYDGDKQGWNLNVTVKSDNLVLFQTKSFLSFETLTGKNPDKYMIDDYFAYLDDVDFYDSLFLRGEPILIFELEYSAKPEGVAKPSQYNFNFYNFKCYDTQTLVANGNNLSSSEIGNLTLKDKNIIRQMTPSYNLSGLSDTLPELSELITDDVITNRINKIAEEKRRKETEKAEKDARIAREKAEKEERIAREKAREELRQVTEEMTKYPTDFSEPYFIPKGAFYGSGGVEREYVLFGMWPQSIKDEDVSLSFTKKYINGWKCSKGSDGFYYVKAVADPYYNDYRFDDGNIIEKGQEYYFKLEPITWCVITDNYQGRKLLLAENILELKVFDNNSNNYEDSDIRAWLNDDFIKRAFTKKAIEYIETTLVDNSEESTSYEGSYLKSVRKYICDDTYDKVFLLSVKELLKSSYGLDIKKRRRETTDYSRAMGVSSNIGDDGDWWIRTPECFGYSLFIADKGDIYDAYNWHDNIGVVPALTVSF